MEILASVTYPVGHSGATHEDRWLFYIAKRDKQLVEKVPEARRRPDKLAMTWTGPHVVTNAVSLYVYECEPMIPV
jgi:hypothetical protein